jgi:hypothetical protein
VSREIVSTAVLERGQFGLLALHRLVPERRLTELIERSQRVGDPIRLSLFHVQGCGLCSAEALVGEGQLCARGAKLIAASHEWRPRAG